MKGESAVIDDSHMAALWRNLVVNKVILVLQFPIGMANLSFGVGGRTNTSSIPAYTTSIVRGGVDITIPTLFSTIYRTFFG